ncbi:uncharacterized protein SPSK_01987 [Sporothrix schenckii 1099-18]|uniref:Uncharacterized protein n=2 Tax=Sporothrix schenckii TaxID=29908 RepID=U7PL70_SPOS1|nr:uncharacterized protein SPSK_01987 [Sporothrix schenckii 1099-18]ERS96322.1 hypothetical protein HMPREF1624_07232 [Sporothrix schenckii ATCC 58251]KJR87031.1 hypothetical protein SPSK_01987 [Sporothrix schenckii 1099-18]
MYGSYGSYSSMSSAAETSWPINIGSGRSSTACAFPSWPNRACLGSGSSASSCSSYLSDEDLFLDDMEDPGYTSSGASSRSNSNASSISPPQGWRNAQQPFAVMAEVNNNFAPADPSEDELAEIQRERSAYQRELVRAVLLEKERRKTAASAARRQRRAAAAATAAATIGASPSASSRKKSAKLTAIAEDA